MKYRNASPALLKSLPLALALLCAQTPAPAVAARQAPAPAPSQTPRPSQPPQPSQQPQQQPQPSRQEPQQPQQPQPQQQPQPAPREEDDEVVRITANLVQLDVTVTDKDGRPVADLGPEEFEVFVDGRPQAVTELSYVATDEGTIRTQQQPAERAARSAAAPAALAPPVALRPEQVRRTIALVADDIGVDFESIHYVRRALKKFVDEQMRPGDLVAVMRTSAGMGSLQQFTSDKRLLYRAIEQVKWLPRGRGGISPVAAISSDPSPRSRDQAEDDNFGDERGSIEDFREEIFTVGTLSALNFIIRGVKDLPGRKSLIVFSNGSLAFGPNSAPRVQENLRRLVDLASRSSVVINTIDARGLQTLGVTAADDLSGMTRQQVDRALSDRRSDFFESQGVLSYLAQMTGGLFIRNNNDLPGGVRRVLEAQKSYYLVGFRPDDSLFDQERGRVRYNSVEIKVRRKGLRVRTRNGFYGFTEQEARPVLRTRREQVVAALTSPFASGAVPLRLTSLFVGEPPDKNVVLSLLHIDVSGFRFEEQADGWHKAVLDVVALTFGEGGQVVDEVNRTETIRARDDAYRMLLSNGLNVTMQVPVRKPGAYQLRVVVRDAATEKIGSASQFIEVPDLKKGRLALSGIALSGPEAARGAGGKSDAAAGAQGKPGPAAAGKPDTTAGASSGSGDSAAGDSDARGGPSGAAVRRFRRGAEFLYFFDIYNAQPDKATGRPRLTTQTRLFRDGQPVFEAPANPFNAAGQADPRRLRAGSRLRLGKALQPGEYLLQVIVTDELAKPKHRVATQWIDFEIVE